MSKQPKVPPRFVPTLTEVVPDPAPVPRPRNGPQQARQPTGEGAGRGQRGQQPPSVPITALPLPDGFEELLVHRVMQRVDVGLDQRLRDAIATVVQEQTRSVLPRLREEIESVVRQVVYEAVADELAGANAGPSFKT